MKKLKKVYVDYCFDWTHGISIKRLREDLDKLEKLGVTEIMITPEDYYGNPSVEIKAFSEILETEEEYQTRIDLENKKQEDIKQRELRELDRLKAKYNK